VPARTFAGAALRYWLDVFPYATRELRHWRARARQIADPELREHALLTQRDERGNIEGAAAFAVLVPRLHRARVVRAAISFQLIYDYADTLAEQPSDDPLANGHNLHMALVAALEPGGKHPDYYRHAAAKLDNGYMRELVETCRRAFGALPSYASVAAPVRQAARRIVAYQAINHGCADTAAELARWGSTLAPPGSGLRWWEAAAGGASSLAVFALIAAAARPALSAAETRAMHDAYFPWIGALHVLLDSLIDRGEDACAGHHSLVDRYRSVEETAARLREIAVRATHATDSLPGSAHHALLLAAMASFYLSAPKAQGPETAAIAGHVLEAMGAMAAPTMTVFALRRAAARASASARMRVACVQGAS
jgi:tetraprenyl-beta-curcumene synthase